MTGRIVNRRGAIGLGIILMIVLTALLGRRLAVQSHSPLTLLSDDCRTGGGAGVVRWAGRLGIPTRPLQAPLWEVAQELPQPGNCVITAGNGDWQPFSDAVQPEQWPEISRWVQAGNALIVVTSDVASLPDFVSDHFTGDVPGGHTPHLANGTSPDSSPGDGESVNVATRWGGSLAVSGSGPRLESVPEDWVLAGSSESAVLVNRPLGDGRIYLLLDEDAWANAGFDRADNAATLARILRDELAPGGDLAIDHYRHGRGRVESFTTFLLALPGAATFCWMSLVIGLCWVWARNQRLGPAEEFHEAERRTAQEYIEAVAALNHRARAAPLALQPVVDRVQHLLHQRGHTSAAGRELIEQARAHVSRQERPASPSREMRLVRELIQLRRELYGTRPDPRSGDENA